MAHSLARPLAGSSTRSLTRPAATSRKAVSTAPADRLHSPSNAASSVTSLTTLGVTLLTMGLMVTSAVMLATRISLAATVF